MTTSQKAKSAGLKSLAQVTEITGVSKDTLRNWNMHKPELFRIVIAGCVAEIKSRSRPDMVLVTQEHLDQLLNQKEKENEQ